MITSSLLKVLYSMKTDTSVTFLLIRVQIQTKETKKKNPKKHQTQKNKKNKEKQRKT